MNATEKAALIRALMRSAAAEIALFQVHETDSKSAVTALDDAKKSIAKKKGDYAIVVVRK